MTELYGYGPDCCGPDDSAYSNHPDLEDCPLLADAATGLTGPAADAPDLTAGGPQEPRSEPAPASPTLQRQPALRIDLRAGIVDLRSVPAHLLYGGDVGEYRRALDMVTDSGRGWSAGCFRGLLVVTRLEVIGDPA